MRTRSLIILGAGQVGRALVRQLLDAADLHAARDGVRFKISAWCDQGGQLVRTLGLEPHDLRDAMEAKAKGHSFSELLGGAPNQGAESLVAALVTSDSIVVDVTASPHTIPALKVASSKGLGAVTANKLPLVDRQELFDLLMESGRFRYESTVGSAVPVIQTVWALNRCADEVVEVNGVLSGTLGYLCTSIEQGTAFSSAIQEAMRLGYTEPDPRVDLGGQDVARKALILARSLGWRLSLDQVSVESLVPDELSRLPLLAFLERMHELDGMFAERAAVARSEDRVLRYVAELQHGRVEVRMRAVSTTTAIGRLRGNDNLVAFHTRYYPGEPLVLQGRGAGVDAAAAGVHADIVALAQTRQP